MPKMHKHAIAVFVFGLVQTQEVASLIQTPLPVFSTTTSNISSPGAACSTASRRHTKSASSIPRALLCHHSYQHEKRSADLLETLKGTATNSRRACLERATFLGLTPLMTFSPHAIAASSITDTNEGIKTFQKGKSRKEGYSFQRSKSEWATLLSTTQLNVLRKGGTERQHGSILEKEKRNGSFFCAGCNQLLFNSIDKFDSGTGWPSFDSPASTDALEIEQVGWIQSMDGAEVRCQTCGSHLGDVFPDGWRYGSKTGKRYCINGAALVFRPIIDTANGMSVFGKELRGDIPPPNKVIQYEPALRRDS